MENPCITLTTDFGPKDGFVGAMKGVLWSICPRARLADISQQISPQNILEGALVLFRAYSFFPAGTVHLAVVDPGVGTERRPIAARLGEHFFVGPDNGLFTPILEAMEKEQGAVQFVHANNPKFWLPEVSRTFHGRDIFAPVAAHLANGVPLEQLGAPLSDPVRLSLPKPMRMPMGWQAHIMAVDHFGNLTTDLPATEISGSEDVLFRLRGWDVRGLSRSYGERESGELVALVNSLNFVEIAVVNGNAARMVGASVGDVVEVILESKVESYR